MLLRHSHHTVRDRRPRRPLRRDEGSGLIARRPYNNRYNDASGAREDHLG